MSDRRGSRARVKSREEGNEREEKKKECVDDVGKESEM